MLIVITMVGLQVQLGFRRIVWGMHMCVHKTPRRIGPFKRIHRDSLQVQVLYIRLFAFSRGPEGFRQVRGHGMVNFHLSWYLLVSVMTGYGQKS